jgi:hypothetical protein
LAAFVVIYADVVADQIKHIKRLFTSTFLNKSALIANKLPMLLPILFRRLVIAVRGSDPFHLGNDSWIPCCNSHRNSAANFSSPPRNRAALTWWCWKKIFGFAGLEKIRRAKPGFVGC